MIYFWVLPSASPQAGKPPSSVLTMICYTLLYAIRYTRNEVILYQKNGQKTSKIFSWCLILIVISNEVERSSLECRAIIVRSQTSRKCSTWQKGDFAWFPAFYFLSSVLCLLLAGLLVSAKAEAVAGTVSLSLFSLTSAHIFLFTGKSLGRNR